MKTHSKNKSWCRYLGTTPDSSSLAPLLTSICQQLSYTFMLPFEDIPDDLVPLTAHMKELLNQVYAHSGGAMRTWWWVYQAFFLYAPKKTETEKLSFFKKLRLKIEKKLKTEPKKLRSLEALCSGHSPKNSDYWRPYLVTWAKKTQITKKTENWGQKTQITGGSSLIDPPKKCTKKAWGVPLECLKFAFFWMVYHLMITLSIRLLFYALLQAFFLVDHAKTQGEKTQGFTKTQGNFPPKTQGIGGFPPHFQQNSRYWRFLRLPERVGEQK